MERVCEKWGEFTTGTAIPYTKLGTSNTNLIRVHSTSFRRPNTRLNLIWPNSISQKANLANFKTSGYYRSGSNGQKVCSPRLLRPWKPKTCSLCSKDRLHTCPLSGERSAPTLRPRKLNYEALQLRASTRPHAACLNFKSLTPLTMTPKVSIV